MTAAALSIREKIDLVREIPKAKKAWPHLSRDEKDFVIASMEIGYDKNWILVAIEDARQMRKAAVGAIASER